MVVKTTPPVLTDSFCRRSALLSAWVGVCRSRSWHREKVPKSWPSKSFRSVRTTTVGFSMAGSRTMAPVKKAMVRLLPAPWLCQTTPMRRSPGCATSPMFSLGCFPLEIRCPQGLLDGGLDGVELVVAGHLLDQLPTAVIVEDDEVLDKGEEPVRGAGPFEHDLEFGGWRRVGLLTLHCPPGLEPLLPGIQGPNPGQESVGDDLDLVHGEHGGEVHLVVPELLPGFPDVGVLVSGVLELDVPHREPVDEQDDVGPTGGLGLLGSELVDGQPVVVRGVVEVQDPGGDPADGAVGEAFVHGYSVDEVEVEGPVPGLQCRPVRVGDVAQGRIQRFVVQVGVQSFQGVPQAAFEDDLGVVVPLCGGSSRGDVRPVGGFPTEAGKPVHGSFFDVRLVEGGHVRLLFSYHQRKRSRMRVSGYVAESIRVCTKFSAYSLVSACLMNILMGIVSSVGLDRFPACTSHFNAPRISSVPSSKNSSPSKCSFPFL